MDPELVKLSHILANKKRTLKDSEEFLEEHGFNPADHDMIRPGKIIAISRGSYYYDFLMYEINSVKEKKNGYEIRPADYCVEFCNIKGRSDQRPQEVYSNKRYGIDLFLPYFYLDKDIIFVSSSKVDSAPTEKIEVGWTLPPKHYLTPDEIKKRFPYCYDYIRQMIEEKSLDLKDLEETILHIAKKNDINIKSISSRIKTIEGTYAKLKRDEEITIEKLHDINGIRILSRHIDESYDLVEILHKEFLGLKRFYDFIAVPKANGFQALMLRPINEALSLDIHIQTEKMYHCAEYGPASNYRFSTPACPKKLACEESVL